MQNQETKSFENVIILIKKIRTKEEKNGYF